MEGRLRIAGVGGINFEEGRIRIITPTAQGNGLDALTVDGNMDLPNSKRGAFCLCWSSAKSITPLLRVGCGYSVQAETPATEL